MSRKRRDSLYFIDQGPSLIKSRDRVRKYLNMWNVFPKKATYIKVMGQKYNGEKDARLTDADLDVLNNGIDEVKNALDEFQNELNNDTGKQ